MIDEVPVLALLAAHASRRQRRFLDAGELRVKESDRLGALARGIRALGGNAGAEGDDLVVGGGGLRGGAADAEATIGWRWRSRWGRWPRTRPCEIEGMEAADVSFPGFVALLRDLGAAIEVLS